MAFELTEEGFRWIGDYEITADEILGGIAHKACKLDMEKRFLQELGIKAKRINGSWYWDMRVN